MNKTFKRFAAILSVVALVGAIFIGCGKSEAKKDSTSKGTTELLMKQIYKLLD